MTISEEFVTKYVANELSTSGWEIIAVHPPDGQGPFVIPRRAESRAIERSSFHPDVVAIRPNESFGAEVLVVECKPTRGELESDLEKLKSLADSRDALLFVLFRCQSFFGGPAVGVDYDRVFQVETAVLPIRFALACAGEEARNEFLCDIGSFRCDLFVVPSDLC